MKHRLSRNQISLRPTSTIPWPVMNLNSGNKDTYLQKHQNQSKDYHNFIKNIKISKWNIKNGPWNKHQFNLKLNTLPIETSHHQVSRSFDKITFSTNINNSNIIESYNTSKPINLLRTNPPYTNWTNTHWMQNEKLWTTLISTKINFKNKKGKFFFDRDKFISTVLSLPKWPQRRILSDAVTYRGRKGHCYNIIKTTDLQNGKSENGNSSKLDFKIKGKNPDPLLLLNDPLLTKRNGSSNDSDQERVERNTVSNQIRSEYEEKNKSDSVHSARNQRNSEASINDRQRKVTVISNQWNNINSSADRKPRKPIMHRTMRHDKSISKVFTINEERSNCRIPTEQNTFIPNIRQPVRKGTNKRWTVRHKTKNELLDEYFLSNLHKKHWYRQKTERYVVSKCLVKDYFCRSQLINWQDIIKHDILKNPAVKVKRTHRKSVQYMTKPDITRIIFNGHCNSSNFSHHHWFGIQSFSIFGLCEGSGPHSYLLASIAKDSLCSALFNTLTYDILSNPTEEKILKAITLNSFFLIKNIFANTNISIINSPYDTKKYGITICLIFLIQDSIIIANWGDILAVGWYREENTEIESLITRELGQRHWGDDNRIMGALGMTSEEKNGLTHIPNIKLMKYTSDLRNIVVGTNSLFEEGGLRNVFKVVADKTSMNVTWEEQTRKITKYIIQVNLGKIEEYEQNLLEERDGYSSILTNKVDMGLTGENEKRTGSDIPLSRRGNKDSTQLNQSIYIPKSKVDDIYIKSYSVIILEFL